MKITSKILSIPPYLSTTWENIASLHVQSEENQLTLIVTYHNEKEVEIPGLNKETIDEIFEAHTRFSEEETTEENPLSKFPLDSPYTFSVPLNSDGSLDTLPSFQHNAAQANLPPLAPEILRKIASVTKALGLEDFALFSKPEEGCNCMYCQLTRALQEEKAQEELEEVTQDDLRFRDWEIVEIKENLYSVTNPLDANEHYQVYLGTPVGCTCGSAHCEHIRAVLSS